MAKAGWSLEQFRARAYDSLEKHGGMDRAAFEKLCGMLRYVDGDYHDAATFTAIKRELGSCERPAHYLAIPPVLFGLVVEQLEKSGAANRARVIVRETVRHGPGFRPEPEFDPTRDIRGTFDFPDRSLSWKTPGEQHDFREICQFDHRAVVESHACGKRSDYDGGGFRCARARRFYDQTGAIRDVIQNHLFQVITNLAMEPPVRADSESIRDEKVKVLKAIEPLRSDDVVRGQFRGFHAETGVAADSRTKTFAAIQFEVNSWRWKGVPFYIRAGKNLPVTCTELMVRLKRPPMIFPANGIRPNHFRFRISPDVEIAHSLMVKTPDAEMSGELIELVSTEGSHPNEMGAYERALRDAMMGDATLFAREDYVEEAWRIVDPILNASTPVYEYEPGTWGPGEVEQRIVPPDGWNNPVINKRVPECA